MWLCSRSVAHNNSCTALFFPHIWCAFGFAVYTLLLLVFTHSFSSIFPYLFFSFLLPFRFFFGMLLVSPHTATVALKKEVLNLDRKDQRMLQMSICLKCFPDSLLFHVNVHISLKYETSTANNRKSAQYRISATRWGDLCSLTTYEEIFGVAVDGSIHSTAIFVKFSFVDCVVSAAVCTQK